MSESSSANPASYHEVIADIAFTAGHLAGKGNLVIEDSRELMSNIVDWAMEFERAFDGDRHGDDYMGMVDEYAELCLLDEDVKVSEFLERMRQDNFSCQP